MCQTVITDYKISTVSIDELIDANNLMKKRLLNKEGYTPIPYIKNLIQDLYNNHIKLIIASSSSGEAIEQVMKELKIAQYFEGYISGSSVKNPKPAPDIFIAAVNALGITPAECVVIEDSSHGIQAARAANMVCIGFYNPHSGKQDLTKAHYIVEGFDEVDYEFIQDVYQQCTSSKTILSTKRTIIRELTLADMPALYQILHQVDNKPYIDNLPDTISSMTKQHAEYISANYRYYGYGLWGIFDKENDTLIGQCGIELKTIASASRYVLSYLLDVHYQGRGYAFEFASAVISYSFNQLKLPSIIALIDPGNVSSIKLATRLGMALIDYCIYGNKSYNIYECINESCYEKGL